MSTIRSEMVMKAKAKGLCTQCLKNKHAPNRVQCQRCIDTNKRKREKKPKQYAMYQARNYDKHRQTPERKAVIQFCVEHYICTKCMRRPTTSGIFTCDVCRARNRMVYEQPKLPTKKKRGRPPLETKKKPDKTKQREYAKRYQRKKLHKKVSKLDKIRYAVEKGKNI